MRDRAGWGTCIPDFERLVIGAGDDGLAVGREGHGAHVVAVRALLLCFELQGCCSKRGDTQLWDMGRIGGARPPASQTLSVLSDEPETTVLPSGEKATELTLLLCALCFSALSSKDAATSTEAVRAGSKVWRVSVPTHPHPRL